MRKIIKLFTLLVLTSTIVSSCVSSKKFKELETAKMSVDQALNKAESEIKTLTTEKENLMVDKTNLQGQVDQIKSDLAGVQAEINSVKTEMKKAISEKEAEISRVKGEINGAFSNLNASGLNIRQEGDMFYVSMEDHLLFGSGSTRINKSGRDLLEKMANIIKGNPGMSVMVEGHTDDVKLREGAAYSTNWELSVARAVAVARRLQRNGVDPKNLIAAGRGEHAPAVTDNMKSSETRKQNRRVEFAIIPNVGRLYNMK